MAPDRAKQRRVASIATARAIPPFLCLIVGYVSYVVVGPLAINYLINPPAGTPARVSAGLAIPIAYLVLLIPVAVAWLRLLLVVWIDPGYIPNAPTLPPGGEAGRHNAPGLEEFWTRDVFVCSPDGLPLWCPQCCNWKQDRTHHNQDTGRCTRKMDHFCPWVGGVVGERSLKFFIQFLFYTMVLALYLLIVFAYFVSKSKDSVHWLVVLGMAAFFFFFTSGMVINSLHLAAMNRTTIENIKDDSRHMYLAVVLPPELQGDALPPPPPPPPPPPALLKPDSSDSEHDQPLMSELDDPSHESYFKRQMRSVRRMGRQPQAPSQIWKSTVTYPLILPTDRPPLPAPPLRKFAVLELPTGMNPWDLGTPWRNLAAVFGSRLHEWLIPYRHSPCCDHSSAISEFPLGPQFEQLIQDAALLSPPTKTPPDDQKLRTSRSRKRKPRLDPGWQNGERPNGWLSEKEARRVRNEWRRQMRDETSPDPP